MVLLALLGEPDPLSHLASLRRMPPMSGADRLPAKNATLTDVQRRKFLQALADNPALGIRPALRAAGVAGTGRQLRDLYDTDDELQDQARDARGWNLTTVEGVAWQVAIDPDHPSWDRANSRILKAYHPAFRDKADLDVNVTGHVELDDRSASLDAVAAVLAAVGATTNSSRVPQRALPAARPVLAEPPEG